MVHMFTVGSHGHGDSSSVDPAIFFQIQHGQAVSTYPRINKTFFASSCMEIGCRIAKRGDDRPFSSGRSWRLAPAATAFMGLR